MTKRVWIFGDSYADPNWDKESFEHETWYEMLAKQYEYNNFAKAGTGPHYSMVEFYRRYKQFDKEDLIIWVLSGEDRIQFHLPKRYRTNEHTDIQLVHDSYWDFKNQEMKCNETFDSSFYQWNKDHMSYTMKTFEREVINSNKKNESFLYAISRINKCKIYIFFLSYNDSYIKDSLNDNLFHIYPISLQQISINEYRNPGEPFYEDNKRINHLSEENHKVMYELIHNFDRGLRGRLFEPDFKQNILDKPDKPDHKSERFIYD